MKKIVILAAAAAVFLSLSAGPATAEEFQARFFQTGLEHRVLKAKIVVDGYTTTDEIAQIRNVLDKQGFDAFMNAFASLSKGSFQILGGAGVKVNLPCAFSYPTEKGRKILLFTQAQDWDMSSKRRVDPRYQYMVFELSLNEKGKGSGKIYEQANIELTNEGTMIMKESNSPPVPLMDVREVKN